MISFFKEMFTKCKRPTAESIRKEAVQVQKRMTEIEDAFPEIGYHYLMARNPEYRKLECELEGLMAQLRSFQ